LLGSNILGTGTKAFLEEKEKSEEGYAERLASQRIRCLFATNL
jgi:hypothetical protein